MYTKDELAKMPIPELMEIANELGVKVSQDDELETVIYAILDKAAEDSAAGKPTPKRKRTRIAKDTSKVYTVNGSDGENLDAKAVKPEKKKTLDSLFAEQEAAEAAANEQAAVEEKAEEEKPAPKKRGRKSKKELEEIAAAEAAKKAEEEAKVQAEIQAEAQAETQAETQAEDIIPEAEGAPAEEMVDPSLLNQLQEKMNVQHQEEASTLDGIWEGDPGDGTDFIPVVDLPIEDGAAIPTLDMFDRPVVQAQEPIAAAERVTFNSPRGAEKYDFNDLITGNGVLEILQDGYGFLRSSDYNYLSSPDDIYVSPQQIKRYGLKTGDVVDCTVRPPHDNEKYFAMNTVNTINGRLPQEVRDRVAFEHLTPLFPDEKFTLCGDKATTNPSVRIVDLFAPIGKGQLPTIPRLTS